MSGNHGAIREGLEVSLPGANTRTERARNFELLKSNGSAIDNRNIRRLRATNVNTGLSTTSLFSFTIPFEVLFAV